MDANPQITIIVPVHNRASIVNRTLHSIHAQTWRPLHIILVDNNSTDSTLAVLRQWQQQTDAPDFRVTVLSEPTPGAAAARNCGLRNTTTEFTMFFDSDDVMLPNHVSRTMQAFTSNDRPDIVGWNIKMIDRVQDSVIKPFYANDTIWHCSMHGSMGTQRYAARTELFRRAGEWNPKILGWDDIELGARMLLLNPKIKKIQGPITVEVYQQEISISGVNFSHAPQKWETALDAMERTFSANRRHRRYINLRRALLAGNYTRESSHNHSHRLLHTALAKEPCPFYRALMRLACAYTGAGGRGAARLLRIFF